MVSDIQKWRKGTQAMENAQITMVLCGKISNTHKHLLEGIDVYGSVGMRQIKELATKLCAEKRIDAFIAPAGAAAELEKYVSQPVIRSDPSLFDLLETILEAEKETGIIDKKIALILHSSRRDVMDSRRFQPFLKNELNIFFYESADDIQQIINKISLQEYAIAVGGTTVEYYASKAGMRSFLNHIGIESITIAAAKAKEVSLLTKDLHEKSEQLHAAINLFSDGFAILDSEGIVVEINSATRKIFDMEKHSLVGRSIESIANDDCWSSVYRDGNRMVDHLLEGKSNNIFTTCRPILVNGNAQGAVATFQEAHKIEALEQKYRKFQSSGLVARYHFEDVIGQDPAILETIEKARIYARTDSNVLIEGETGTGKEIFAQSIHNCSERSGYPFVAINCAALPESLLESELMGYEEGAFTGAKRGGKPGLFELAHNGTIFLDEINRMPLTLQPRVLRILQEREVMRLGGKRIIPVDVRVIAASNENLEDLSDLGEFREDLYYRLKVLTLQTSPLRERPEDIPLLLEYYYRFYSERYGKTDYFAPHIVELLKRYQWPGNVRELANCVERYVVLSREMNLTEQNIIADITHKKIPVMDKRENDVISSTDYVVHAGTLENMSEQIIRETVRRCNNSRAIAAKQLGISRTTLWKKIN